MGRSADAEGNEFHSYFKPVRINPSIQHFKPTGLVHNKYRFDVTHSL